MNILLTGFEPFGGESVNPSWQVVQALDGGHIAGTRIVGLQLPCVFGAALDVLHAALAAHQPALVLALGQAGGRADFSIERVAINVDDARIADNGGAQPIDRPVIEGAAAAHFSTLPIKAMVLALRQAGLPASVSQTAGTFVCNHVFYGLMHALRAGAQQWPQTRGGFMHLPLLPEQAARLPLVQPSMPLATMVHGVRVALECAVLHAAGPDLRFSDGTLA
ncbi:MAG: pyroglutamyl-peptidase I [Rubrivivax sp.]